MRDRIAPIGLSNKRAAPNEHSTVIVNVTARRIRNMLHLLRSLVASQRARPMPCRSGLENTGLTGPESLSSDASGDIYRPEPVRGMYRSAERACAVRIAPL